MKTIITWYNRADQLVKDAHEIQADIADRVVAFKTREEQFDFVAEKVAPAVANRYGASVVRTRTGGVSFEKADGSRDSTALSALRYWLAGTDLMAASGSAHGRNKSEPKVTPRKTKRVAELLAAFHDLSAAERAAFLAGAK